MEKENIFNKQHHIWSKHYLSLAPNPLYLEGRVESSTAT